MIEKELNCDVHGKQPFGLLCEHLAKNLFSHVPIGFHEHDEEDLGRPDAWCNHCEANWDKTETDEDRDNWFINCNFKIICAVCWDEAERLNKE